MSTDTKTRPPVALPRRELWRISADGRGVYAGERLVAVFLAAADATRAVHHVNTPQERA